MAKTLTFQQVVDVVNTFTPFYQSSITFISDKPAAAGAYGCLFCGVDLKQGETAAVSYAKNPARTWAHPKCLTMISTALSLPVDVAKRAILETDAKKCAAARKAAKKANKERRAALVSATSPTTTTQNDASDATSDDQEAVVQIDPSEPTMHIDALREQIAAEIDEKYGEQIQQAVKLMQNLRAKVNALQIENAGLHAELAKRDEQIAALAKYKEDAVTAMMTPAELASEKKQARVNRRAALPKAS